MAILKFKTPANCCVCMLEVDEYAKTDTYCIAMGIGLQNCTITEKYHGNIRHPDCPLIIDDGDN